MDGFERMKKEMASDALKQSIPDIKNIQAVAAELMMNYFKVLVLAGFNENQALSIVIAHGMVPRMEIPNLGNEK